VTEPNPSVLTAVDLAFGFPGCGGMRLLSNLSFSLGARQICSVIGPSGIGKSTLLKILAGLIEPTDGRVVYGAGAGGRPEVLYHPQEAMLLPWITVVENAELGLRLSGLPRTMAPERLLSRLALGGLAGRHPAWLSGGQIERVALARTLLTPAAVYLLDEPLSGTDYALRVAIEEFLLRFVEENDSSIILVTHDLPQAAALSDFILAVAPGAEAAEVRMIGCTDKFSSRSPVERRGSTALGPFVQDLLGLVAERR
jgi:NitT/TauT family transport system ATP-binding protein